MKKAIIFFSLFAFTFSCCAQNTSQKLVGLVLALDSLTSKLPVEKAHLHIDKPFYSVGDTIWVKAYVTDQNNQLSTLSRLLHVELINANDSIKTSLAMPLSNGLGWGAITLYDSVLRAGNYTLRAYTSVMRNYDSDYFFNRSIAIGNALPGTSVNKPAPAIDLITDDKTKNQPDDISLSFFPEGGNLISNIASTVAFKATGRDGLSRDINGYIIDKDGNRVADFVTEHAGMGKFKLFAKAGSAYTAVVTLNGTEKRIALPQIQNEGYNLAATQDKENIFIKVISSAAISDADTVNLIAQANNEVLYTGKATLNGHGLTTTIDKRRFPNGIIQLTLFNKAFAPVAERLLFIRHSDQKMLVNITNTAPDNQKPGTMRFNLLATDAKGKAVNGAFSVAVTNAGKVPYNENNEISIFSTLLLTSDLKGYIEQPNYYFSDTLTVKDRHLDNLLLTQGWRRFVWQDVLSGKYKIPLFKPEHGDIGGVVTDAKKQPVAGARVALLIKGEMLTLDTVSDAQGRFVFNEVFLNSDEQFLITATDEKGKAKYTVTADKPDVISPPKIAGLPVVSYGGLNSYLENAGKDYQELKNLGLLNHGAELLKQVEITEQKLPPVQAVAVKHSANLRGPGKANQVVTFMDLLPCGATTDLESCLISIGKLNNIYVTEGKYYARQAFDARERNRQPMTIYVNGAISNVFDGSVSEISSIEIIRSLALASIYGNQGGAGGVILITTKTADIDYDAYKREYYSANRKDKKKQVQFSATSFAPRREFYTPAYNAVKPVVADLRSTIYWKPNVVTDQEGRATIEFLPGNTSTNYRIVLEGVGINGELGRKVITYNQE